MAPTWSPRKESAMKSTYTTKSDRLVVAIMDMLITTAICVIMDMFITIAICVITTKQVAMPAQWSTLDARSACDILGV